MTDQAAESARALAAVLLAHAEALASDDLDTVSAAMTSVRGAARELEAALTARGWGGGVLYGWGAPLDEDDDEDEDDFDDDDLEDDDQGSRTVPDGVRMSYQARYDVVVVDEEALAAYVEQRAAASGTPWDRTSDCETSPLFMLTHLMSFGGMDFEGTGLEFAGGQDSLREVAVTLWEMDGEEPEDQFPTS